MSENTTSFEDILKENGFRLASYIDEADRKDIANFLSGILEGKGGATDAEVEAILESYIDLGLPEEPGGLQSVGSQRVGHD